MRTFPAQLSEDKPALVPVPLLCPARVPTIVLPVVQSTASALPVPTALKVTASATRAVLANRPRTSAVVIRITLVSVGSALTTQALRAPSLIPCM
jgi:hypothetical protein